MENKVIFPGEIDFKINMDKLDKNEVWITVFNKSSTRITISNPFNYPVTTFKIYDTEGMEFYKSKFKFSRDYGKDTIQINPNKFIKQKLNIKLNEIFPDLKYKNFNKIIAIYQYKAFLNDDSVLTDTLNNNEKIKE